MDLGEGLVPEAKRQNLFSLFFFFSQCGSDSTWSKFVDKLGHRYVL